LFQIKNGAIVIALYLNSVNITRNLQIKFEFKSKFKIENSKQKYKTEKENRKEN
jgi:hypothetical protein